MYVEGKASRYCLEVVPKEGCGFGSFYAIGFSFQLCISSLVKGGDCFGLGKRFYICCLAFLAHFNRAQWDTARGGIGHLTWASEHSLMG